MAVFRRRRKLLTCHCGASPMLLCWRSAACKVFDCVSLLKCLIFLLTIPPREQGNDLSSMSNTTLAILTNEEAIAVNQDKAGKAGMLRKKSGLFGVLQVWTKELSS